ncbi:unnamed protein product, partial [marine sediment metagenome]
ETVDGKNARMLDDITLLNVALTGNPVNTSAQIRDIMIKSMDAIEGKPIPRSTEESIPTSTEEQESDEDTEEARKKRCKKPKKKVSDDSAGIGILDPKKKKNKLQDYKSDEDGDMLEVKDRLKKIEEKIFMAADDNNSNSQSETIVKKEEEIMTEETTEKPTETPEVVEEAPEAPAEEPAAEPEAEPAKEEVPAEDPVNEIKSEMKALKESLKELTAKLNAPRAKAKVAQQPAAEEKSVQPLDLIM